MRKKIGHFSVVSVELPCRTLNCRPFFFIHVKWHLVWFGQADVYFPTSNFSTKSFWHVMWTSLTLRVFPSCGSVHHILTGHFDGDTPLCNQSCSQLRGVKYKLNWWILAALLACNLSCASVTRCPTRTYQRIQGFDKDMLSYICWKPPTETLYPQTKADYRWFAGALAECWMLRCQQNSWALPGSVLISTD